MPYVFILLFMILISCGGDGEYKMRTQIGEKVYLDRFPDSTDRAAVKELRHYKRDTTHVKKPVSIGLTEVYHPQVKSNKAQNPQYQTKTFLTTEEFVDRFAQILTQMKNDPDNSRLSYQTTLAQPSTMRAVLQKKYGRFAESIPDVLIKYELQALNSGVALNNLNKNETVVFPRVDLFK